jgi:hypothetical protein
MITLYYQDDPESEARELEVDGASASEHSGYVRSELRRAAESGGDGTAAASRVYFVASDHATRSDAATETSAMTWPNFRLLFTRFLAPSQCAEFFALAQVEAEMNGARFEWDTASTILESADSDEASRAELGAALRSSYDERHALLSERHRAASTAWPLLGQCDRMQRTKSRVRASAGAPRGAARAANCVVLELLALSDALQAERLATALCQHVAYAFELYARDASLGLVGGALLEELLSYVAPSLLRRHATAQLQAWYASTSRARAARSYRSASPSDGDDAEAQVTAAAAAVRGDVASELGAYSDPDLEAEAVEAQARSVVSEARDARLSVVTSMATNFVAAEMTSEPYLATPRGACVTGPPRAQRRAASAAPAVRRSHSHLRARACSARRSSSPQATIRRGEAGSAARLTASRRRRRRPAPPRPHSATAKPSGGTLRPTLSTSSTAA